MSVFINILIALIAIILLLYVLKRDLGLFLLSFIIIIQYIWMFLSLIVIESGIFINEQGRKGYFVYSSIILLLFFISTLLSLIFFKKIFTYLFNKMKVTRFHFLRFSEEKITLVILASVLLISFINIFLSPIPLFSDKVNKFNFWDYAKFPFLKPFIGNILGFMAFGAALLYRSYKKSAIILIVLYFLYLVFLGQKFSGFLVGIYGLLLAFYFSSQIHIKFRMKWFLNKYTIGTIILLFLIVLYKYTLNNPFEYLGLTPLESVFYRAFGLQAHVFWGVVEQYIYLGKQNTWNPLELWKGMHHLMLEFWPWSHQDYISVTTRGLSWTNAYPSILIRIFPLPIALIANFFLISFVAFIQTLLLIFIKKNSILMSVLLFQLLTWTSYAFTMAYFNRLVIPILFISIYFLFKLALFYVNRGKSIET